MVPTLIIIGVVLFIVLIWLIVNYNRFARIRQHIRESWSDIDVELKRRYDLIPNLIRTVKGYAAHEKDVLEQVTALRNTAAANRGPVGSQATDEVALLLGLRRLIGLVESYPQLKADQNFLALQKELADTEDRIAAARRFYNANVREMNQLCAMFPTSIIASMFGFKPEDFFELSSETERIAPRIEM
ncbi:MAG: LemA family protein [Planctomycetes bacterium]|nr:LemA family protein [Planctomycetota bacterium]NOG53238.1 LemA family protein [Planctomycetota bacterium]